MLLGCQLVTLLLHTYLQTMSKYGYQGFVTVEVSMMVQRRANYDPLLAATQSYYTLSQAFVAANIQR